MTRKITQAVSRIHHEGKGVLKLGNLDSKETGVVQKIMRVDVANVTS